MAVAFTNRVILPSRSVSGTIQLRIAKPLLLVSTPIGVLAGLREAWRFHGWLALLMALLLAVVVLNFLLIAFTPGDPITLLVGDFPAPPEYLDQMRREFGLDQPVWVQLLRYLGKVVQGDFGYSIWTGKPVQIE